MGIILHVHGWSQNDDDKPNWKANLRAKIDSEVILQIVKAHLDSVGKSDGLSHPDKGNNWSINVVDGSDQGDAALSAFLQTSKDVMVSLPMVSLLFHKGVRPPQPLAKGTLGVASLEVVATIHIHLKKCHKDIVFEENTFDG